MRIAGIVLLVAGALMIATSVLKLAVGNRGTDGDGLSESQLRMDAVVPGAIVGVIGFALVVLSRPKPVVTAVAAEDWAPVKLSEAAADFAKRAMVERKFAPETALRIMEDSESGSWSVKFDLQSDGDEDVVGEDQGVIVVVEKSLAPRVAGTLIDIEGGTFLVRLS
ncbi:MAG TPA: hypothetical protein VFB80_03170 [Pirellulaceae bacterium]|nr:hypothetical protein [Pirellulaceae bacterium]